VLCVLDVNETLLDLSPLDQVFEELTGDPAARREWFALVLHTALTITAAGQYRDFTEIAGASATAVAARHHRELADEDRQRIAATMRALPAHPDVPCALARLNAAGARLVTLTNSPLSTAREQLRNAGLEPMLSGVFSAAEARALKPAAAAYRVVLDAHGIQPHEAMMIAAHDWDIAGAQAVGMRTAFLARPGHDLLPGQPTPTMSAPDLGRFADLLIGQRLSRPADVT
jgi:2-haloacid dehalogenase